LGGIFYSPYLCSQTTQLKKILFIAIFATALNSVAAQQTTHRGEFWGGYITSLRFHNNWAVWNDFHYVPSAFFAARTGISYFPVDNVDITAGYAWVTTATSFSDKLIRPEHRPWGQIEARIPLNRKFTFRTRFRYDARFRNKIVGQEVTSDYVFVNRYRFMNSLRYKIKLFENGDRLHINILDEFLINSGKTVNHWVDQNRLYLMMGYTRKNITLLAGYDYRYIPQANKDIVMRHGFTFWVIHNINLRKNEDN
jgi:hypothetical protein